MFKMVWTYLYSDCEIENKETDKGTNILFLAHSNIRKKKMRLWKQLSFLIPGGLFKIKCVITNLSLSSVQ